MARFVRENWDRVDHELPHAFLRQTYDDVMPCLVGLRVLRLKMGIVSNIPSHERLITEIAALGLTRFFPMAIASGSIGAAKPDKLIFESAAQKIGEPIDEILFVGDDLRRDYEGASHAGMKAILVDRRGIFKKHDVCRIASLREVPSIIS